MATIRKPIDDMTRDELKAFVNELLREQVEFLEDDFDIKDEDFGPEEEPDTRSLEEVFRSMDENMWTPPLGSPSPAEMIREDRDNQ